MSIDFMIALANTLEVSLDELFYDSLTIHKINDGYASILDGCSFVGKGVNKQSSYCDKGRNGKVL